jgi:hypothetical protein
MKRIFLVLIAFFLFELLVKNDCMCALISKYELRMITIKEYQFHDRDTHYYEAENNY